MSSIDQADKRMKEMSPGDKALIDKAMTKYIRKNYKKNRNQIFSRLGLKADNDLISEIQQTYYVWIYTHLRPDMIREDISDKLIGYFFSFLLHKQSIFRTKEEMNRGLVNDEDTREFVLDMEDVEEQMFTNGHLNANEDTEVRIELYSIAREETIQWLNDNPESNTAIAMRRTIKRLECEKMDKNRIRECLIDYITAPNGLFHKKILKKELNLKCVKTFKEEFAALYSINDGKPVTKAQLPTNGWK